MKTLNLKTLIATIALATASTATFAADDSPAALRVQQSLSQPVAVSVAPQTVQSAVSQNTFAETGMSVAAGRLQQSIASDHLQGEARSVAVEQQDFMNDSGKSVSATRVQNALSASGV